MYICTYVCIYTGIVTAVVQVTAVAWIQSLAWDFCSAAGKKKEE